MPRGRPRKRPPTPVASSSSSSSTVGDLDSDEDLVLVHDEEAEIDKHFDTEWPHEVEESAKRDESESSSSVTSITDAGMDVDADRTTIRKHEAFVNFDSDEPKPPLLLPTGSADLDIDAEYVLTAIGVYEILRRFRKRLRLSPFLIEDFCAALNYPANSLLLSEIHGSLLKTILRDEELAGTQFGPLDVKDSLNLTFQLLDPFTLPDLLRAYFASDPDCPGSLVWSSAEHPLTAHTEASAVLERCVGYPFDASVGDRLTVLRCLADVFLLTAGARTELFLATLDDRRIVYDDQCRVCNRGGDLLCCETCSAVFHLDCLDPPLLDIPAEEWRCPVCVCSDLHGVTDCLTPLERNGALCRHEPLGEDRFGRRYWFLARRIVIEPSQFNQTSVYFSTGAQVHLLLDVLDAIHYEAQLVRALRDALPEVLRQMAITEEMTNNALPSHARSVLQLEIARADAETAVLEQHRALASLESLYTSGWQGLARPPSPDRLQDSASLEVQSDSDLNLEACASPNVAALLRSSVQPASITTPCGSVTIESDVISTLKENSLAKIPRPRTLALRRHRAASAFVLATGRTLCTATGQPVFRLADAGYFRTYTNHFGTNPLALTRAQLTEERDRRRALSHKFALGTLSEFGTKPDIGADFTWALQSTPEVFCGLQLDLVDVLRVTLTVLEACIGFAFTQSLWKVRRIDWLRTVQECVTPQQFGTALATFEAHLSPRVLIPYYFDGLGHVQLVRLTETAREAASRRRAPAQPPRNASSAGVSAPAPAPGGTPAQLRPRRRLRKEPPTVTSTSTPATTPAPQAPSSAPPVKRRGRPTKAMQKQTMDHEEREEPSDAEDETSPCVNSAPRSVPRSYATLSDLPEHDQQHYIVTKLIRPPRHSLWRIKGEEYRSFAGQGWYWVAVTRRSHSYAPRKPSSNCLDGLLAIREAEAVREREQHQLLDCESRSLHAALANVQHVFERLEPYVTALRELKALAAGQYANVPLAEQRDLRTVFIQRGFQSLDEVELDFLLKMLAKVQQPSDCSVAVHSVSDRNAIAELTELQDMSAVDLNSFLSTVTARFPVLQTLAHNVDPLVSLLVDAKRAVLRSQRILERCYSPTCRASECDGATLPRYRCYASQCNGPARTQNCSLSDAASTKVTLGQLMHAPETNATKIETLLFFVSRLRAEVLARLRSLAARNYSHCDQEPTRRAHKLKLLDARPSRLRRFSEAKIGEPCPVWLWTFTTHRAPKRSSVFILPPAMLARLARCGGQREVLDFSYAARIKPVVGWPYEAGRPSFRTMWRLRTATARTLSSVALQLRILWVCLRWDELREVHAKQAPTVIATDWGLRVSDDELDAHRVVDRRPVDDFHLQFEYCVERVVVPLEWAMSHASSEPEAPQPANRTTKPNADGSELESESEVHGESVLRKLRKRRTAHGASLARPFVQRRWTNEANVQLWEIKRFCDAHAKLPFGPIRRAQRNSAKKPHKSISNVELIERLMQSPKLRAAFLTSGQVSISAHLTSKMPPELAPLVSDVSCILESWQSACTAYYRNPRDNHIRILKSTSSPSGYDVLFDTQPTESTHKRSIGPAKPKERKSDVCESYELTDQLLSTLVCQAVGNHLATGDDTFEKLATLRKRLRERLARAELGKIQIVSDAPKNSPRVANVSLHNSKLAAALHGTNNTKAAETVKATTDAELKHLQVLVQQRTQVTHTVNSRMAELRVAFAYKRDLERVLVQQQAADEASVAKYLRERAQLVQAEVEAQQAAAAAAEAQRKRALSARHAQNVDVSPSNYSALASLYGAVQNEELLMVTAAGDADAELLLGADVDVRVENRPEVSVPLGDTQTPRKQADTRTRGRVECKKQTRKVTKIDTRDENIKPPGTRKWKMKVKIASPPQSLPQAGRDKLEADSNANANANADSCPESPGKRNKTQNNVDASPSIDCRQPASRSRSPTSSRSSSCSFEIETAKPIRRDTNGPNTGSRRSSRAAPAADTAAKCMSTAADAATSAQTQSGTQSQSNTSARRRSQRQSIGDTRATDEAKANEATAGQCETGQKQVETIASGAVVPKKRRRLNTNQSPSSADPSRPTVSDLYCVCQTPYDETAFYVGCDRCNGWFHGSCVGVSAVEASTLATYVCPRCCTADEPVAANNHEQSKSSDIADPNVSTSSAGVAKYEWASRCGDTPITAKNKEMLKRLLRSMSNQKCAWPFSEPVDPKVVPDYYAVIRQPTDLLTISRKLDASNYSHVRELLDEMALMFANCRAYNAPSSMVRTLGDTLEQYFDEQMRKLVDRLLKA